MRGNSYLILQASSARSQSEMVQLGVSRVSPSDCWPNLGKDLPHGYSVRSSVTFADDLVDKFGLFNS